MSLTNKFVKATFWYASTTYFFAVVNLLGQLVIAKLLMPTQFGVYAFALAVREFIGVLLGFSSIQSFIYSDGSRDALTANFWINSFGGICFCLIGVLIALLEYWITGHYQASIVLAIVCISNGVLSIGNVLLAPFEKALNYKPAALIRSCTNTLSLFIAIYIAYYTRSTYSLPLRDFLQASLMTLTALFFAPVLPSLLKFPWSEITAQFKYNMLVLYNNAAEVMFYRIPDLVINFIFGKAVLGNFYLARYVAYIPIKLAEPFVKSVLMAFLVHFKRDHPQLSLYTNWLQYILVRGLMVGAAVVLLWGAQLFGWVYGEKWTMAAEYFRYMSVFMLLSPLVVLTKTVCSSIRMQWVSVSSYMLGTGVFVLAVVSTMSPAVIAGAFSLGIFVVYVMNVSLLHYCEVRTRVGSVWLGPAIFLAIIGLALGAHFSIATTLLIFWCCLAVLLLIERRKICYVFSRLRSVKSN